MSPRVHNPVVASSKAPCAPDWKMPLDKRPAFLGDLKPGEPACSAWHRLLFRASKGRFRCLKASGGEETHVAAAGTAQAALHAVVHRSPRLCRRHRGGLALSKSSFTLCRTTRVLRLFCNSRPARFLSDPTCHFAKLPDHGTSAVPV